jgi:predicted dehydrogenase
LKVGSNSQAPLRLALVGCGYIAQAEHIPALLGLTPEIEVVATVDPDRACAAAAAAPFRAASFLELEQALDDASFEAVLIATPAPTHARLVRLAAGAGKHVLLEKPIAYDLAEARATIEAVRASGVTCMVAYHRRYDDDCLRVKTMIDEGTIGSPRAAVSLCRLVFPSFYRPYASVAPKGEPIAQDLPSDWLAENSIHHINLLRWWLGDVTAIHSATYRERDHDLGILSLSCGDTLVSHHQLRGMECGEEISIYGTEATIHCELWYPHRPYSHPRISLFRKEPASRSELIQARRNPYANEIVHFAQLLAGKAENRSTLEDSYRDLEILRDVLGVAVYTHAG